MYFSFSFPSHDRYLYNVLYRGELCAWVLFNFQGWHDRLHCRFRRALYSYCLVGLDLLCCLLNKTRARLEYQFPLVHQHKWHGRPISIRYVKTHKKSPTSQTDWVWIYRRNKSTLILMKSILLTVRAVDGEQWAAGGHTSVRSSPSRSEFSCTRFSLATGVNWSRWPTGSSDPKANATDNSFSKESALSVCTSSFPKQTKKVISPPSPWRFGSQHYHCRGSPAKQ